MQVFIGGCQCAAVRYRVTGLPVASFACHCTDCQRQSASAFGMAAWIDRAQLQLDAGQLQTWVRNTPGGKAMRCDFCGHCGSRLFHQITGSPYLSIKTGSLDDPARLPPTAHIWVVSKQAWFQIPAGVPQFAGNPASSDALFNAWHLAQAPHASQERT